MIFPCVKVDEMASERMVCTDNQYNYLALFIQRSSEVCASCLGEGEYK